MLGYLNSSNISTNAKTAKASLRCFILKNIYVESLGTLGASDGVLSLFIGELDYRLAVLTFTESRGLYILESVNKQLQFGFYRTPDLQKLSVFSTSFIEISGHETEHSINCYNYGYKLNNVRSENSVYYTKDSVKNKQEISEAVKAVSARKKTLKFCSESVQLFVPLMDLFVYHIITFFY